MRAFVCVFALVAAGCAAQKRTPPAVARLRVLAGSTERAAMGKLSERSYLRLEARDLAALLKAKAGTAPPAGEKTLARTRGQARAALEQARASYRRLRFGEAEAALARAQAALTPVACEPEDFAVLGRLALERGLNLLALKNEDEARGLFAAAFFLGYEGPAKGQYSPEVESRIIGVRDAVADSAKATLTVKVQPVTAEVWVDGRPQGTGPVTVQLPPGQHHVRLSHAGYRDRAFFHTLAPKAQRLEVYLKPVSEGALSRQLAEAHREGRLAALPPSLLSRIVGPDHVLLEVRRTASGLEGRLLATRPSAKVVSCSGADPEALARCLGPRLYRMATGREVPKKGPPPPPPVYHRWWFWTLVGAGVAGGTGAGIYLGTRAGGTDVDIVSGR